MAEKEKSLVHDSCSNDSSTLPVLRVKKEPADEYADATEWIVKFAESERLRVFAEEQLQMEKEEAARALEAEKTLSKRMQADVMKKFEVEIAGSIEKDKQVEAVTIENRRLEEELEKSKADLEKARKEWKGRLEESEKRRAMLEESLENEQKERVMEKERSNEIGETKNRQFYLARENKDLQDRMRSLELSLTEARSTAEEAEERAAQSEKELVEQIKKSDEEEMRQKALIDWAEMELKDAQTAAVEANKKQAKLEANLEEMRNVNRLLATTESGKIYDELTIARKCIEELEKKVETVTPKASDSVQTKKRKRQPEDSPMADMTDASSDRMMSHSDFTSDVKPVFELHDEGPRENVETEKGRRSSRRVSKPVDHTKSMKDSDEYDEPKVKKARPESAKIQFRRKPFATPTPTRPQCFLCDAFPENVLDYAWHIRRQHASSLEENGVYLLCSCNYEVHVEHPNVKHGSKCNGHQFTVCKLDQK